MQSFSMGFWKTEIVSSHLIGSLPDAGIFSYWGRPDIFNAIQNIDYESRMVSLGNGLIFGTRVRNDVVSKSEVKVVNLKEMKFRHMI